MDAGRLSGRFVRYQLPAVVWAVAIFVGSSVPGKAFPDVGFDPLDKVAHVFEFAVLSFFLLRAFVRSSNAPPRRHAWLWTALCGTAWAVADEIHQVFVPGRVASTYDLMADTIGVTLGLATYAFLHSKTTHAAEETGED